MDETFYSKNIANQYYFSYKIKHKLYLRKNEINMSIDQSHRINMTHIPVYSIDPSNCQDVDDAFSYYEEGNQKYICVHIADPTEHIPLYSESFYETIEKAQTRYPSNHEPVHMLDKMILEKSTLHENHYGSIKKAITIIMQFDELNHLCFDNTMLYFTNIRVEQHHKLSYDKIPEDNVVIQNCLKLSESLFPNMIYNQDKRLVINYNNLGEPFLHKVGDNENKYKIMIAKFAIFCNHYIAYILKHHLPHHHIIFRNCPAINDDKLQSCNHSFQEFMNYILMNGVSAKYDNMESNHGILQLDEYLHMTSPIRRSVDCIIHYLIKSIYFGFPTPLDENELSSIIHQSNIVNKKHKKIQFRDYKFRFLQCLEFQCETSNPVRITFYFSSYFTPFLNLILCNLNNEPIHISYVMKINESNIKIPEFKKHHSCEIHHVHPYSYYDEGSLPDIDSYVHSILCHKD